MKYSPKQIQHVIDNEDIMIEFQPILSLNTRKYIGLEALARGEFEEGRIPPLEMFAYAQKSGIGGRLDSICMEKAMRAFTRETSAPTLFMNIFTGRLDPARPLTGEIRDMASRLGVSPQNIVLELNIQGVKDSYALMMFADMYRSKGFHIALDNVTGENDDINRIMLINPDIIKIDRSITQNIDENKYHQEVFRSVTDVARQIGAMTVACGVERTEEVITCVVLGVDYFQGFYFQRPDRFNYLFTNEARVKVEQAADRLNISLKNNPTVANMRIESCKRIIYDLVNRLVCMEGDDYNAELKNYVKEHEEIECAFLIDKKGFQITDTVMAPNTPIEEGYHPAIIGESHSIKNYFYAIKEQIEDPFISGWYTSNATGHTCKTISSKMYNKKGEMTVVCCDLLLEEKE
ncbi:MAG: EAL domain-containing protein [Oscillospiraceae bacterium]|nr:EAL domain-containing protein [Oscillospiraceae bacterium]